MYAGKRVKKTQCKNDRMESVTSFLFEFTLGMLVGILLLLIDKYLI